jgi:hypothetical protein
MVDWQGAKSKRGKACLACTRVHSGRRSAPLLVNGESPHAFQDSLVQSPSFTAHQDTWSLETLEPPTIQLDTHCGPYLLASSSSARVQLTGSYLLFLPVPSIISCRHLPIPGSQLRARTQPRSKLDNPDPKIDLVLYSIFSTHYHLVAAAPCPRTPLWWDGLP